MTLLGGLSGGKITLQPNTPKSHEEKFLNVSCPLSYLLRLIYFSNSDSTASISSLYFALSSA